MDLFFPIGQVSAVLAHAIDADGWLEIDDEGADFSGPKLWLVSGEGVYFTSNAIRTKEETDGQKEVPRAYALGMDPTLEPNWKNNRAALLGDRDHFEVLPWVEQSAAVIADAAADHTHLIVPIRSADLFWPTETTRLSV